MRKYLFLFVFIATIVIAFLKFYSFIAYFSTLNFILLLVLFFINVLSIALFFYEIATKKAALAYEKLYKALEETKAAKNRFEILFQKSTEEIFLTDFKGNIVLANPAACKTHEYSQYEMLKMNLKDLKTKRYKEYANDNLKKIIRTGVEQIETEHLTKAGQKIPYEMRSSIVEYNNNHFILSIARNLKEQKETQKKLLTTIIATEEKERKKFAANLHDDLGPLLSTIKLYTNLLKSKIPDETKEHKLVKDIEEITELSISTARDVTKRMTPAVLEEFGLATALKEFCRYINTTQSVKIIVSTSNYKKINHHIEETILYQISKELINNTLKHAQANNIRIELKTQNDMVLLYYKDDGIGFNPENKLKFSTGLGLNNIVNKVKTIKGNCDFYSANNKGLRVLITLKA